MGFWLISLLMFVVMMVVLEVLPHAVPIIDETWLTLSWLPSLFMVVLILMMAVGLQLLRIYRQVWLSWLVRVGVVMTTLMMVCMVVLHVVFVHKNHTKNIPTQTLQVTATVFIDEISDSVYDEITGTNYRQKAYLTNIRPIVHDSGGIKNPLYDPQRLAEHTNLNISYPKELTVLLNARPHKNSFFTSLNTLTPNTSVSMTLEISPLVRHEGVGFDGYRWLVGRHIHANARILAIDESSLQKEGGLSIQGLRQIFREHFLKNWHEKPHQKQQSDAVTLSLLTGDRALIDKSTKDLYQFSGISHLLAISGTHVLFLALILAGLVGFLLEKYAIGVYKVIPRWQVRFVVMSFAALLYALFTGFDVPAVRTVYFLLAVGVARYLLFGTKSFKVLVVVGLVMAWLDPYVLWQAGFWLSFVAVALLLRYETTPTPKDIKSRVLALVKLQTWLFVTMLPISILIFGKVSVIGFFSNLFAVGLFGWVIVPLNMLAGVFYGIMPSLADWLWSVVSWLLGVTHALFELIRLISGNAWLRIPISIGMVVLMFLAMLPWLLPRVMPRYLSLPVVCLCVLALSFARSNDLPNYKSLDNSQGIKALLVQDDESAWLIVQSDRKRIHKETLSDELMMALHKHGVRSLTGVIVQTPNEALAQTMGVMSQSMMIEQYWQAGSMDARQGKLIPSDCVAGRVWEHEGLHVEVMTGWRELPNETVHDCSIKVSHAEGLFGHEGVAKTLMVDAHRHDRLWQLWQMLCREDGNYEVDLWFGATPSVFENASDQTDGYGAKSRPVIDIDKTVNY